MADDIFLVFERDNFAEKGVKEYLAGYVAGPLGEKPRYRVHWAIARPARFINPPETLLWNCRLDGKAYEAADGTFRDARVNATQMSGTIRWIFLHPHDARLVTALSSRATIG